jgi:lysophospholipase L1-like esterase
MAKYIFNFLLLLFLTSCQPKMLNVLCFGDSITQGRVERDSISQLSYRYWLWEKLDSAGFKVDMLGTNNIWHQENRLNRVKVPVSPYTGRTFDTDHEGYYGIKTAETLEGGFTHDSVKYPSLKERLQKLKAADVAFVHIGTNDGKGDSLKTIIALKQIVEQIYFRNNKTHIFLAKLNTPWVRFVNHAVEPIIAELRLKYPKIKMTYVDMAAGWVNCIAAPGTMTYDWTHPNVLGQKTMANNWYKAFKSMGDKQKPTFTTNIKVSEQTDSTATITWTQAIDNKYIAGYNVIMNDEIVNWRRSECGTKDKQCIALVTDTTFTITNLRKGLIYKVIVSAVDFANNSSLSEALILEIK